MWTIIKFENKNFFYLRNNLIEKFKNNITIYKPKIKVVKYLKRKKFVKEINLLGDYLFCYNKEFKDQAILKQASCIKGLKYFVQGYKSSQKEIEQFIAKCKEYEDEKGYLSGNFFDFFEDKEIKLSSGPLAGLIFKILKLHKNKLNFMLGNFRVSANKENLSIV
jgi:hypothetical protein